MITESISILLIVLFIIFILLRGKHADYAISVCPTLIVPTGHVLVTFFLFASKNVITLQRPQIVIAFADIVFLAITCALFAIFSHKIKNIKTKHIYLFTMIGYSVILTCAFVYQTINPVLI